MVRGWLPQRRAAAGERGLTGAPLRMEATSVTDRILFPAALAAFGALVALALRYSSWEQWLFP